MFWIFGLRGEHAKILIRIQFNFQLIFVYLLNFKVSQWTTTQSGFTERWLHRTVKVRYIVAILGLASWILWGFSFASVRHRLVGAQNDECLSWGLQHRGPYDPKTFSGKYRLNVMRIWEDWLVLQLEISDPSQSFKCRKILRQETSLHQSCSRSFQPILWSAEAKSRYVGELYNRKATVFVFATKCSWLESQHPKRH